jgi:predicted O-methyltransferase YrrM
LGRIRNALGGIYQDFLAYRKLQKRVHPRLMQYYEPIFLNDLELRDPSPLESVSSKASDIFGHLPTLYLLTTMRACKNVLELGTRTGLSTVALLSAVKQTGGNLTSIDVEDCPEAREKVAHFCLEACWTFIKADDLMVPWQFPIDHLFIDTTHTYEQTKRELMKFEPWVRVGGIISLHDVVSYPEVWTAIREHFGDRNDVNITRYFNNNGLAVIIKDGKARDT